MVGSDRVSSDRKDTLNSGANVWLIGGTSESAELAQALAARQIPFVVTVTTAAARALYSAQTQVVVGALSEPQMETLVSEWRVVCVLDASHPFAQVVSESAIALSLRSQQSSILPTVAYLRYERSPVTDISERDVSERDTVHSHVSVYTSIERVLNNPELYNHRILFTLGYRALLAQSVTLSQLRRKSKLFVRILPSPEAISAAIAAGFSSKEIVALRPPVSYDLEKAIWQQWNISAVVAKASGKAGGEAIKRKMAAELDVHLHLIQRPAVAYPHQTHCIAEAVSFCEKALLPAPGVRVT